MPVLPLKRAMTTKSRQRWLHMQENCLVFLLLVNYTEAFAFLHFPAASCVDGLPVAIQEAWRKSINRGQGTVYSLSFLPTPSPPPFPRPNPSSPSLFIRLGIFLILLRGKPCVPCATVLIAVHWSERSPSVLQARLKNLLREARRQFQEHKKKDNAKPYSKCPASHPNCISIVTEKGVQSGASANLILLLHYPRSDVVTFVSFLLSPNREGPSPAELVPRRWDTVQSGETAKRL